MSKNISNRMDEYIIVESDNGIAKATIDLQLHTTFWMNCTSLVSPERSNNKVCTLYDSISIKCFLNADKNMKGTFCTVGEVHFLISCNGDT